MSPLPSALLQLPARQQMMARLLGSLPSTWETRWSLGSLLQPGPAPAAAGVCAMNQAMEGLSMSGCFSSR